MKNTQQRLTVSITALKEDFDYIADVLGYKSEIEVTVKKNMSVDMYNKIKEEEPKRKINITDYKNLGNVEVTEIITEPNTVTREEFLNEYTENYLKEFIKETLIHRDKQQIDKKNQKEIEKVKENIENNMKRTIIKTTISTNSKE